MTRLNSRIAAAATVLGLGGIAGFALGQNHGQPTQSTVAAHPLVHTKVIRQTIHVTKHAKPKHPAAAGGTVPGTAPAGATAATGAPPVATGSSGSSSTAAVPLATATSGGGAPPVSTATSGSGAPPVSTATSGSGAGGDGSEHEGGHDD
ncbi:MAG: hypothetical protein JSU06_04440 [Actinobacteria bacterium]|nr:hypothetical protein [Actinomycetota bacterium]